MKKNERYPTDTAAHHDENIGEGLAEARGADHRPANDRGARASYVPASLRDYPLPRDPHQPPGYEPDSNQAEFNDYGLNETVNVGHDASVHQLGLDDGKTATSGRSAHDVFLEAERQARAVHEGRATPRAEMPVEPDGVQADEPRVAERLKGAGQ